MNLTLSLIDFFSISPFLILLFGSVAILITEIISSEFTQKYALPVAFLISIITMIAILYSPPSENVLLTTWLHFDQYAKLFGLFFLSVCIAVLLLSAPLFNKYDIPAGEYLFFLLSGVIGLLLIGYSADFLTLFIGMEIFAISLYLVTGYIKKREISHESAMKFFLTGAFATGVFLYGIALLYGATGSTQLLEISKFSSDSTLQFLFLSGIAFVTVGLAFKATWVPFHQWAPDVYEGAPSPVVAFLAVGSKAGAYAAFLRIFALSLPAIALLWHSVVAVLAAFTLIYANFVALRQQKFQRFIAYSSIAHSGFLMMPLVVGGAAAFDVLFFYLIVYALATFCVFAAFSFLENSTEGVDLKDIKGLFYRSPLLSAILGFGLLTLAGLPPSAGFFAKLYLLKEVYGAGYVWLVIIGLLTAILSAYYYMRIAAWMFLEADEIQKKPLSLQGAPALLGVFGAIALLIISVAPETLLLALKWIGNH